MSVESAILVSAALLLSLGLNRLMIHCAPLLGLMDQPGERRIHHTPVPRAGGIAIWVSFMTVVAVALGAGLLPASQFVSWDWYLAFAAGSGVLIVTGVIDDRHGLRPLTKLTAHVVAPSLYFALYPFATGLFPEGWSAGWDYAVFVIWAVVLINAFNLIDGLDGLCGGLAAISALAMACLALINGLAAPAVILFVMGAALLGFLRYNFNPARIFLGDAGSMLLGFFLATAATEAVGRRAVIGMILLPVAVAGVPLFDMLLAIWRRGARRFVRQLRGESVTGGLFDADSDHLHHRLLASGGSQRKVAAALQAMAILFSALAFLPMLFGDRLLGLSLVGFLVVGLVALRHLARVEIEHTASVVHLAIKLPTQRRRIASGLFFYDLFVFLAAGAAAVALETNLLTRGDDWMDLAKFVLVFTVFGSLATLASKLHLRLWARATMRDLLSLQFWVLASALGTFTLFSLVYSSLEWSCLRMALMSYVFAAIGVSIPRVLLDISREFGLEARHRNPGAHADGNHGPVVVLGAGDLGCLLLDHLKSSAHDAYPGMRVLGFLDESGALHGRRLRSFRILGGLSTIPSLVADHGLRGIVLAINHPRHETVEQIEALAEEYGLRIYRWKAGIAPLGDEPLAAWATPISSGLPPLAPNRPAAVATGEA